MRHTSRLLAPLALIALLPGCGMHPLYSGGTNSPAAKALASVRVDPIPGKDGWLMRNALDDRLSAMGHGEARYVLKVQLDDQIEGLGVRADDTVTRERRTLRARYELVDTQTNKIILVETSSWDAGIDVASSDYATVAAESSALERLAKIVADRVIGSIAVRMRE